MQKGNPATGPQQDSYTHYAFDNADFNIRTLTGHGTFHSLGGVSFTTPAPVVPQQPIPRILDCPGKGTIGLKGVIPVSWYKKPPVSGLQSISAEDVKIDSQVLTDTVKGAIASDVMWLAGRWAFPSTIPAWNGFMKKATKCGEVNITVARTKVEALPFVNLEPSNPSAIYTALSFAVSECRTRGQVSCLVTFDQPLYAKASEIVAAAPPGEFDNVVIRLGGFHLLMSYLGAIGYIMSGSGLDDLWTQTYAKATVVHMTSGHAYSRSLRAHFLTQEALVRNLLSTAAGTVKMTETEQNHLKALCLDALNGQMSPEKAVEDLVVSRILDHIVTTMQSLSEDSRTAKLWSQYYRQVELIRLFIRAERTGDWKLHLFCVQEMLPFLHAAGHYHYAKSAHLYLQQMMHLDEKMPQTEYIRFTTAGYFTIRRSHDFWAGVWSDMAIEQDVMRPLKSRGGLTRGRGIDDSSLAHFVAAFPLCLQLCKGVENISGIKTSTSEQHVELRDSRRLQDTKHADVFVSWFKERSPWDNEDSVLRSLFSGVIADDTINCDEAEKVGKAGVNSVVGKKFSEIKLARKDRVVPLAAMSSKLKVRGDVVEVNPQQLFMRIICVMKTEEDRCEYLKYELAPTAPALFVEGTMMRKTTKSSLVQLFPSEDMSETTDKDAAFVLDGGYLLHVVVWPRPATFGQILSSYRNYVFKNYGSSPTVVFDGYGEASTTKTQEHGRRSAKKSSVEIVFNSNTVVTQSQADFLSNPRNKARFITALTQELRANGAAVHQSKSDADAEIVSTALALDAERRHVNVVGTDTDILCMLLARARIKNNISFTRRESANQSARFFNIRRIQKELGPMKSCVLFAHAISGCDTTSAIYRKGKKLPWKLLLWRPELRETVQLFNTANAKKEDVAAAGETFLLELYNGQDFASLDALRVHSYGRAVAVSSVTAAFDLATLPPTTDACYHHFLRTYLQVQEWLGVEMVPTEWGWRETKNGLEPITMAKPPAPESLLHLISCNCKSTCTSRCECRRSGLECSWMCGKCRGVECENSAEKEADAEDFDNDDD